MKTKPHNPELLFSVVSRGENGDVSTVNSEITLRDLFAAAALTGYLTNGGDSPNRLAKSAFEVADAMLAERARGYEAKAEGGGE